MRALFLGVLFSLQCYACAGAVCSEEPKLSCPAARLYDDSYINNGKAKFNADACCVFWPGVMDVYQEWDEKRKHWVIDMVELTTCDGYNPAAQSCAEDTGRAYSPSKMHNLVEGYARHITPVTEVSRSLGWGNIDLDATDDEVAEKWVNEWKRYGSCISTWNLECFDKTMPPGEEEAWNDPGPALFVQTMNELSRKLMRTEPPSLPKRLRRLKFYGSPHLGDFVEDTVEKDEVRRSLLGKLALVANRELSREKVHKREYSEHEEL